MTMRMLLPATLFKRVDLLLNIADQFTKLEGSA